MYLAHQGRVACEGASVRAPCGANPVAVLHPPRPCVRQQRTAHCCGPSDQSDSQQRGPPRRRPVLRPLSAAAWDLPQGPQPAQQLQEPQHTQRHAADADAAATPGLEPSRPLTRQLVPKGAVRTTSVAEVSLGELFVVRVPLLDPGRRAHTTAAGSGNAEQPPPQQQQQLQQRDEAGDAVLWALRAASTWRELRRLLVLHSGSLQPEHIVTVAARMRRVAISAEMGSRERLAFQAFLSGFTQLSGHFLASMDGKALTTVLYNIVMAPCTPPAQWMRSWLRQAGPQLAAFSPQQLANTSYALGVVEYDPGPAWMERYCTAVTLTLMRDPAVAAITAAAAAAGAPAVAAAAPGGRSAITGDAVAGGVLPSAPEAAEEEADGQPPTVLDQAVAVQEPPTTSTNSSTSDTTGREDGHATAVAAARRPSTTAVGVVTPADGPASASAATLGAQPAGSHGPAAATAAARRTAQPEVAVFTAHGLYQVIWALARIRHQPAPPLMQLFCRAALKRLPAFRPQALSNTLWAVATIVSCGDGEGGRAGQTQAPPAAWVARMAQACRAAMPYFNAFDLSITLWALIRLNHTPSWDWLASYLSASYGQLPSAEPRHAARMLWGLSRAGLTPPPDWLRRWMDTTYVRLLEAQPLALATMMWALGALRVRPQQRWVGTLLVSAWEAPLESFAADDLVMLLWGLARTESVPEAAWMDQFWLVSYRQLATLPAGHQALLLWSAVSLGQAPSATWLKAYQHITLSSMPAQNSEGLSLMMYAYGILERAPPHEWMAAFYAASCRDGMVGFDALALERTIYGIAKAGLPPEARPAAPWLELFLARVVERLPDTTYGNLANVLLSLSELRLQPSDEWLRAVMARVLELLDDFGTTTLVKVAVALRSLECDDASKRAWQAALEARMRAVAGRPLRDVHGTAARRKVLRRWQAVS